MVDCPGAIRRGKITSSADEGYEIDDLDRKGIHIPPLKSVDNSKYTIDDIVYFFYFPDGTGKILCGM